MLDEALPEDGAGPQPGPGGDADPERIPAPATEFPVVGIGASAGGLAALEAFFSGMPADREPGMAFVLVQHLAPDHASVLAQLIGRQTRMDVVQAEDGMRLQPDCVYVIPPNRDMTLSAGRLRLTRPDAPRGQRLPVDVFFRSLAQDQGARAIGVVLSGTARDGTLGLRMIKDAGGMAMVQDPETTVYSGMPRSAIATGLVDFVLPPEEMPKQIIAYVRTGPGQKRLGDDAPRQVVPSGSPEAMELLFTLLRDETGHDFSEYKQTTVHRRLQRRMAVQQVERVEDYAQFLKTNPAEARALFQDLLIGVTQFFRDPEAFEALRGAMTDRVAQASPGSVIRVWVPGCSTGEEAYSIAILLREQMEALDRRVRVQVFATDIDPRAIAIARAGIYPASIGPDLPKGGLNRFFVAHDPGGTTYRIREEIREMLVFSEQDVLRDPPFSRLDLISCRNLLIYLNTELQRRLIPLFHYALKPGGLLFLGTSESVGDFPTLFTPLDRRLSLHRRQETPLDPPPSPTRRFTRLRTGTLPGGRPTEKPELPPLPVPFRSLTEATLLEEIPAAALLVDVAGKILYVHGRTGRYLEPAPGDGEMNVLRMAREGLRRELSVAFHRAVTAQDVVRRDGLEVQTHGDAVRVNLVIRPQAGWPASGSGPMQEEAGSPLFLVILHEAPDRPVDPVDGADREPPGEGEGPDPEPLRRIVELEERLQASEEYLHATQEEMQSTHEELRTSIEELQSTNEELQSTNEELETSQEELQSLNEELSTVNAELETRVADLSRSRNDMSNLLAGTGIAMVFVDQNLRIQRFTPSATRLMNLIKADEGRPVGDLASKLVGYDSLVSDSARVLETLVPMEFEVQAEDGRWYLLGIRPYRTLENVIEGAVITFTDITELNRARVAIRETEGLRRLAVVVRDSNDPIVSLDLAGRILSWNPAAQRLYGWTEEEALQMNYLDLVPEPLRAETRSMLEMAGKGQGVEPVRTRRLARDGRRREIRLTATRLVDEAGRAYGISTTERLLDREDRPAPDGGPDGGIGQEEPEHF